jgi:esterase/lipase superfamily enzyme
MEPLMPTPILYTDAGIDPLAHIPEAERWTPRRVYYATVRKRDANLQEITYTNTPSDRVSVGLVLIGFGGQETSWADLCRASTRSNREETISLSIAGVAEVGQFTRDTSPADAAKPDAAGLFLKDFNDSIDDARDKDVLIYVHGAKVNFYNACAFAAQLDHFMGRDLTSMAFSWPTRQDIMSYAVGSDLQRAYDAANDLASLIEVLAAETNARRIHVLSWSAGGRVATSALVRLRERYPKESEESLRARMRIGTAYFAAGDVPTREFLEALPTLHGLVDRVVVTGSSDDQALKSASAIMGDGGRIGQTGNDLTAEEVELVESLERIELVHVSLGSATRGFDITGHRYWFNHPWASTDVLLAIRTDLPPEGRGLVQGDSPVLWYMPEDYPERLRASVQPSAFRRR